MRIAVLITVYNRKDKTLSCLQNLHSQDGFKEHIVDIYIVDGGSIDGTPQAIKDLYPEVHVSVENGLFWAGGMRKVWNLASTNRKYDLFWLLNDDTRLYNHALKEGIEAHLFSIQEYGKGGVYTESILCPIKRKLSYGGRKLVKWRHSKSILLQPNDQYQAIDLGNANSMFVSKDVFNAIGGFCEYCTHGIADYDYTLRTAQAGFPCIITPSYCGECEDDHGNNWKSADVPLVSRIKYLYSPKGLAYKEYMIYVKKFFPSEYISTAVKLWVKTLFPQIWDKFKKR